MPVDIFISYSRRDSQEALDLVERLRNEKLTVWIDQHEVIGAQHWGAEIAENIRNCSTFLLLLSPNSVDSENVLRELMLAVDRQKRILPVEIRPTILPSAFDYAIAGLQHVRYDDLANILRAHHHGAIRRNMQSRRRSLMVLPFEDLSPTRDNDWFADGLTGELISTLANVKSLRVMDRLTSMSFKNYRGKTTTLAQELDVQFFLEGSVRKAGDQIKINVELLDISTGEYLWQHTQRGTMGDIFDIQEEVAEKVVEGLQLHLTKSEHDLVHLQETDNPEAYELNLKAMEYFHLHTKEGLRYAMDLFRHAIELDEYYTHAMQILAFILADYYRVYDRDPELLREAEQLAKRALEIRPRQPAPLRALSMIYRLEGKKEEAEATALQFVRKAPDSFASHFNLGLHYASSNQPDLAVAAYVESLKLRDDELDTHWNLCTVLQRIGKMEECASAAKHALNHFQRWLRLHPDEETRRVQYVTLLFLSGQRQEAIEALKPLSQAVSLDPVSLYNIACLSVNLEDHASAMKYLERSISGGFRNLEVLKHDPDLNPLRDLPEFKVILSQLLPEQVTVSS